MFLSVYVTDSPKKISIHVRIVALTIHPIEMSLIPYFATYTRFSFFYSIYVYYNAVHVHIILSALGETRWRELLQETGKDGIK